MSMNEQRITTLSAAGLPAINVAGISRDAPGKNYPRHTVSSLEIDYISSGVVTGELNGSAVVLQPGHAYAYRSGDVVTGRGDASKGPYVCRWVAFTWPTSQIRGGAPVALPFSNSLSPQSQSEFQAAFDALIDNHAGGQPGWQIGAAGHLLTMIGILIRENVRRGAGSGNAVLDRRLGAACSFMEQNFARRIRILDAARAARLAEDYFSRLFRRRLGVSPMQYLVRLRVQEGRRLLAQEPGLTVREASRRAGIDDSRHFARLFRRRFGMTPDQFRKQLARMRDPG